jgi:hypothetical protein
MPTRAKFLSFLCLLTALAAVQTVHADDALVGHDIEATIAPDSGTIAATDTLTLPDDRLQVGFWLHEGLDPKVEAGDAVLERIGIDGHLARYRLTRKGSRPVTLSYAGRIRHPLRTLREGMGRERMDLIGSIDQDGVFLNGYSGWYPNIPDALVRFDLEVTLPPGWLAVSQGAGPEVDPEAEGNGHGVRILWREDQPQDEIHLSAGRYKLYRKPTRHGEAQAYLRLPDDALAARYLDATERYLSRYSQLIGEHPYAKFALVENFWETGYGMPSFTLLGSRVLRLPFILHSSYPHEILHNWWGNGVFVDYQSGNWSEGLTAYLADHLNQEIDGRGADYRRDQLKAYADYVRDGKDFPLTEFRGRHGSASQAIGYGKMLMTTHMLRVLLGDDDFRRGLQRFYQQNRFSVADFDDLRLAFELAGNRDLTGFFESWTKRTGAAALKLGKVSNEPAANGGFRVIGSVHQIQASPAFPMAVPVIVHAERGRPQVVNALFDGRSAQFEATVPAAPVRVAVDPRFETFRRLLPEESPTALSNLFGAEAGLMLIPAAAPDALRDAYRALAETWQQGHPSWKVALDTDQDSLPKDLPVWLFGWENRFLDELIAAGDAFRLDRQNRSLMLNGTLYGGEGAGQAGGDGGGHGRGDDRIDDRIDDRGHLSLVLTAGRGEQRLGWVAAAQPEALPGLARKLPHYGKYSYLVFRGSAPDNQLKGQWPANDSPLMHWFTEARPALTVPPRSPLIRDYAPAPSPGTGSRRPPG